MAEAAQQMRELTSVQLGVWYAQQLAPDSPAYNIGGYLEIHGPLDVRLLEASIRQGLEESDAARLRLGVGADGAPYQYVGEAADHQIQVLDLGSRTDPFAAVRSWMRADLDRVRDLTGEPLSSFAVLKLGPEHFLWYQCSHHAVLDGVSHALFSSRVAAVYTELAQGRPAGTGAPDSVSVLMDAERDYRASADRDLDRTHWLGALSERSQPESAAAGQVRARLTPAVRHTAEVDAVDAALLRAAARRHRISFAGLLIASAAVYHHLAAGTDDVVVGVSVDGRTRRAEVGIPGMTANVMPLRLAVTPGLTVGDVLRHTARGLREALPHQRYQYADIIRDLRLVGAGSLCGLIVNVTPVTDPLVLGECTGRVVGMSSGPTEDLKIEIYNRLPDAGLQLAVDVNPDVHGLDAGPMISRRYLKVLRWLAEAEASDALDQADLLKSKKHRRVLAK